MAGADVRATGGRGRQHCDRGPGGTRPGAARSRRRGLADKARGGAAGGEHGKDGAREGNGGGVGMTDEEVTLRSDDRQAASWATHDPAVYVNAHNPRPGLLVALRFR